MKKVSKSLSPLRLSPFANELLLRNSGITAAKIGKADHVNNCPVQSMDRTAGSSDQSAHPFSPPIESRREILNEF